MRGRGCTPECAGAAITKLFAFKCDIGLSERVNSSLQMFGWCWKHHVWYYECVCVCVRAQAKWMCCKNWSSISNSLSPAMIPDCIIKLRLLYVNMACDVTMTHNMLHNRDVEHRQLVGTRPAFAPSCQIWDESRGLGTGDSWGCLTLSLP